MIVHGPQGVNGVIKENIVDETVETSGLRLDIVDSIGANQFEIGILQIKKSSRQTEVVRIDLNTLSPLPADNFMELMQHCAASNAQNKKIFRR